MMIKSVQKKIRSKTRRLSFYLDMRTARERLMIFSAVAVAIVLIGERLIGDKLNDNQMLSRQKTQVSQEIQIIEDRIQLVLKGVEIDPLIPLKEARNKLRAKIAEVSRRYHRLTSNLISPEKMVILLDELLTENKGVNIVSINNLPSKPLQLPGSSRQKASLYFYQHSIELEFVADYMSTLNYLKTLESISENILWNNLDYQVDGFPLARVRVVLSTISDKAGWIGA